MKGQGEEEEQTTKYVYFSKKERYRLWASGNQVIENNDYGDSNKKQVALR